MRELTSLTALQPTADVLWPGSLIRGDSIFNVPTPLTPPRRPISLTLSYVGVPAAGSELPTVFTTVPQPEHGTVTNAIRRLVRDNTTSGMAPLYSGTVERYSSRDELSLFLGASYSGASADVQAALSVNTAQSEESLVVFLVQTYYTVSVQAPWRPSDPLDGVTRDELREVLGENQYSPAYISSVSYGRMLVASFVTTKDSLALKQKLHAAFSGLVSSGKLDESFSKDEVVQKCTCRVAVVGGPLDVHPTPIGGFDALVGIEKWFVEGARFGPNIGAFPISYSMRWLRDNSFCQARFTSDFQRVQKAALRIVRFGFSIYHH